MSDEDPFTVLRKHRRTKKQLSRADDLMPAVEETLQFLAESLKFETQKDKIYFRSVAIIVDKYIREYVNARLDESK